MSLDSTPALYMLRTLAFCWNKENLNVKEAKIEESEKASTYR